MVIGHEGGELAELQQINAAVSGSTNIRVVTLKFNRKAGGAAASPPVSSSMTRRGSRAASVGRVFVLSCPD